MERADGAAGDRVDPPLRIYLLGGFKVERRGQAVPGDAWQRQSARTLVKLLAVTPGHRLHREQVQDLLWPDVSPDSSASTLRKALHFARHALEPDLSPRGDSAYIHARDDLLSLAVDGIWIDADVFQASAEAALAHGSRQDMERALAEYGGELLPEDRYEDWAAARRESLANLHHALLLSLADHEERLGHAAAAIEHLRRACDLDPAREDVHQRLMRLYAYDGQRQRALQQYRACREAMREELGTEPSPGTEALYQAILAGRIGPGGDPAGNGFGARPMPLPEPIRRLAGGALVGREAELGSLVGALEEGGGKMVLVEGESGVGKSRLVAEVARIAHERGAVVLYGACYEPEGHLPYGPFVEALDRAVAESDTAERERLAGTYPELVTLIPSLSREAPADDGAEPSTANRTRLFGAVVRLMDELAARRPLLLVLDDLQAADLASLQLLHHLARMAADRRWLLLGTVREEDVEAGGAFQRLCATAVREGLCRRLELERLPRENSYRLVQALMAEGAVPAELSDDLYARSLGNPLFLHELLRALRERGELALTDGEWSIVPGATRRVPDQIRDLIAARVDALGGDVRQALALAATAGETSSFRVLRGTETLAEARLLDALERAAEAQLLEPQGDGYAFRHPLIRATLYERLSPPRRASLHAALADALERQPARASEDRSELVEALAYHWAEAGEGARAVPYLIEAGDRAARVYANADAIARLQRALALLDDLDDVAGRDRVTILERLGDLHALVGETDVARDRYLEAASVNVPAEDGEPTLARVYRKAAQQALSASWLQQAEGLLGEAETRLESVTPGPERTAEHARLLTARTQFLFLSYRFSESLAVAEEALRLAEEAGSPADQAHACEMVAMACLPLGEWHRGAAFERRYAALSDPSRAVREAADAHICFAEYHLWGEQPAEATRSFLRTLEESERAGAPRSLAQCYYYLGTMAYARGRFAEAIARLTEAIALYRQVDSAFGEAMALQIRGLARTVLGWYEAARADLERGVELADRGSLRSHAQVRMYAALGQHYLTRGDAASARRYVELGLALADEPSTCICNVAIAPVAAVAYALTGDVDRAVEMARTARSRAGSWGSPFFLCHAHRAIATVHGVREEWSAAFAAIAEARGIAETHDFPYHQARALLLSATLHERRGAAADLAEATTLRAQASTILLRLGVPADAA